MHLALVTDTYAPRVGGIEAQVAGLARALRAAGHDVDVVTCTPGPPAPGVVRVPGLGGAVPNPLRHSAVRAILRRYDVVHAHMGVGAPFAQAAVEQAARDGSPAVVTVHSMLAGAGALLGPVLRGWARRGVVLTAVSPVAARDVEKACGATVLVVPNGVDARWWAPSGPRSAGRAGVHGGPVLVCVSRLARRKRVVPLVRAFAAGIGAEARAGSGASAGPGVGGRADGRAGERAPGARLVVVGDGPQRSLVEAACARYGVADDVTLTGALDPAGVREILWDADVFMSPARLEAFGIAALEARCAGLPAVAMAGSGAADLIDHGRTGLVVADDTALAGAIGALTRDGALLAGLRAQAGGGAPSGGWADVVGRVEAAYRAATGATAWHRG